MPSLVQRLGTFAKALTAHAADGFERADDDTIAGRLHICQRCPDRQFTGSHCQACGCACNGNQVFLNKLAWLSEKCPNGHWPSGVLPHRRFRLSIGMACYRDFDGVYFTVRSLALHHPEIWRDTELIVVDNCPDFPARSAGFGGPHTDSERVRTLVERHGGVYVPLDQPRGTAPPRDMVFRVASGDVVICVDSHVLLSPGALSKTVEWMEANRDFNGLIQGPMLYDDGQVCDHMLPTWGGNMWGQWGGASPASHAGDGVPFEIKMHGLGLFGCRRDAWLGFNPHFRGFGGEEGYIHEKYRQAGRNTLCLPWLRWAHRFNESCAYPNLPRDTIRNYVLGFHELGLDLDPIYHNFFGAGKYDPQEWGQILEEVDRILSGESVDDVRSSVLSRVA